jgi:dTMP kinase
MRDDHLFIVFDGIDGAGKSTQIAMLREYLESQERSVFYVRDPGSTKLGDAVREILLHREDIPLAMTSEMFLYMAARAQLVDEQIRPALDRGDIVLCDRFLLANVVYQGCAGGLDVETLWQVGKVATGGLMPEITIVLDMAIEQAAARMQRGLDRLEKRGAEYFQKVRDGFRNQLARCPGTRLLIDADRPPEAIAQDIRTHVGLHLSGIAGNSQVSRRDTATPRRKRRGE